MLSLLVASRRGWQLPARRPAIWSSLRARFSRSIIWSECRSQFRRSKRTDADGRPGANKSATDQPAQQARDQHHGGQQRFPRRA
jgi:hypothetical protein